MSFDYFVEYTCTLPILQVWSVRLVFVSRNSTATVLVLVIIKYVHEVAGVTLFTAGQMIGAHIGVCVVSVFSSSFLTDYIRERNILSTTQVSSTQ